MNEPAVSSRRVAIEKVILVMEHKNWKQTNGQREDGNLAKVGAEGSNPATSASIR